MRTTPVPTAPTDPAPPSPTAGRSTTTVVGALVLCELASGLIQGFTGPIVPAIGDELGISAAGLTWVSIVQGLSIAVFVPVFTRLGDVKGHRMMLRTAMVLLALGSLLVALAPNFPVLLVGRFLQGALGCLLPLEFAIARDRLDGKSAASAVARLVATLTIGNSVGSLLVGLLSTRIHDPQQVLLLPSLLVVLAVPAAFFLIPESRTRAPRSVDWTGSLLVMTGLIGILLGLSQGSEWGWGSAPILTSILVGATFLVVFCLVELRSAEPLIDLRFVSGRGVAPLYAGSLLVGVAMFGAYTALTTFLATPASFGYGFGQSTLALGVTLLLTMFVPVSVANQVGGRLTRGGHGVAATVTGFVLAATGYLLLIIWHDQLAHVVAGTVVTGLGFGLITTALPALIVDRSPAGQTAVTSGFYQLGRNMGGSVGGAIFAAVLAARTAEGSRYPSVGGYATVWTICAALLVTGAVVSLRAVGRKPGTSTERAPHRAVYPPSA